MAFTSLTTSTQVANLALQRIGEKTITAITDSNERAQNANLVYQFTFDMLLASYPWRFAQRRKTVDPETASITAFADAGGGLVTVTAAIHGLLDGDKVKITGTTSYNGEYVINYVDANSYTITATFVADDATGTSAWTSDEYEYRYAIPTDAAHILRFGAEDTPLDYRAEGAYFLTNDVSEEAEIVYTRKITDVSTMPAYFIQLLYMKMALEFVFRREGSQTMIDRMRDEIRFVEREAWKQDGGTDFNDDKGSFNWLRTETPSRTEESLFITRYIRG